MQGAVTRGAVKAVASFYLASLAEEIENSQAYAHLMKLALVLPFLAFNPVPLGLNPP